MSQLPIEFHPHAYYEMEEARDWYLRVKESPQAAARLMDELDSAIDRIRTQPERWPKHLSDTRRLMLDRFPYLIIYKVLETSVRIVATCACSSPSWILAMADRSKDLASRGNTAAR